MTRYDWTSSNDPPQTVSERMIHEGIGIMNTRLLMLIDKMIELLESTDRLTEQDKSEFISTFENLTFGKQTGKIKSLFKDTEIKYSQFEDAVKRRNYFIHDYRVYSSQNLHNDAVGLHTLIRQLIGMRSSIEHLRINAKSQKKKNDNKKKTNRKQIIDDVFKTNSRNGAIYKSHFCKLLRDKGIEPEEGKKHWDTLFKNNGYRIQGQGAGQTVRKQ